MPFLFSADYQNKSKRITIQVQKNDDPVVKEVPTPKKSHPPPSSVSRAIVVAWVICTLTALLGELATVVLMVFQSFMAPSPQLGALAVLIVLTSTLSGILGLAILPVVMRHGPETSPRPVVIISAVICGLPLLLLIGLFLGTGG